MSNDNKELSYDDFLEKYTLVNNHFCRTAAHDGCMFETFGEELDFVREQNPKRVWTLIDNNDGWYGVSAGLHFVNRIGYLITEEEWQDGTEEFIICDEGPVNDWFISLAPSKMAEIMSIDQTLSLEEKEDKARDAWYDLSIDEREEIMNKYKTDL